jgi:hypothetical protein
MGEQLHIISSKVFRFFARVSFLKKPKSMVLTKQVLLIIFHTLAIAIITIRGGDSNPWKFGTVLGGLLVATLITYSFPGYQRMVVLEKKKLGHIFLNLGIGLVLSGVSALLMYWLIEELQVLKFTPTDTEVNFWIIVYFLIFVPVQQALYMWQPRVVFSRAPRLILLIGCALFFGLAHLYYGLTVALFSLLSVGLPSAYLCFYRRDYLAAYLLHCITGGIGLFLQIV